ncbi:sodium:calcium antiporter [Erythrobacter sp. YJ-T3-07]|uniref:sodium:calcium antiporter n=1 Tax=Erythrobacter sp. YJ-T3-07 TaxID=2793063 RepID=UPI0018D32371|nr:sodium:calcium antiporter [Erythrobacter sp. YJ-T3-07]MBH1944085.1 sodium:calcium antiporter [Erythrobacter sp. YJ-T3-07]
MPDIQSLPLPWLAALFIASALLIAFFGSKMAAIADVLADRTGLGEALIGAVLLGAGTSISGIVTSITTAAGGAPELAVSNAMGGIAAQTMFLALADIFYRHVNLEHAGASTVNLGQATVLIILSVLPIMAYAAPQIAFFGVHPVSPIMIAVYLIGLHNAHSIRQEPMWQPKETPGLRVEEDDVENDPRSTALLACLFAGLVLIVGACGWVVGESGLALSGQLGISQGVVGALGTAIVTSLPELVTTIAAVRRGALQLAIGGIIGGNMFDALFVSASDIAYRDGSIYHAIGERTLFWMALVCLMTGVLLLGLLRREKQGPGGIGWESVILLALWLGAAALQVALG